MIAAVAAIIEPYPFADLTGDPLEHVGLIA